MDYKYDRAAENVGNIVALEHVNIAIPDQQFGTIFYITGMGFTRDPFINTGVTNMWINIGRSQFHLPTGEPQVLRGHVGLVVPDREALLKRLAQVTGDLDGTLFAYDEQEKFVDVVSPWGNRLRCFEPDPRFGRIVLGMPYVEFEVPIGTAKAIARFYHDVLETGAESSEDDDGCFARCSVGYHQDLVFRESERPMPAYDGHHLQVYLADFSGPHQKLSERGLVVEESNQWQYRFRDIVDLEDGAVSFTIEHEVRSMTHPMYGRHLINRDPAVGMGNYAADQEELRWISIDR